jgi:hypothetical protein
MDGGAKWSAAASAAPAPQVRKNTLLTLAKKATTVQMDHAKKFRKQKIAKARKAKAAKPAATKTRGELVVTPDDHDPADKAKTAEKEKAKLLKAAEKADAMAKKKQAKVLEEAEKADAMAKEEEAKVLKEAEKADAMAKKEEAKMEEAKKEEAKKADAMAKKEAAKKAQADKAKQLEEAVSAPKSPELELQQPDIWATDDSSPAAGTGSGRVGPSLFEQMVEREGTQKLYNKLAKSVGSKASKYAGVADPKAGKGPGLGGHFGPSGSQGAASGSPAKAGSHVKGKKARMLFVKQQAEIKRFKAGRDCEHELQNYNLLDEAGQKQRKGEINSKIERYEDERKVLKDLKDFAKAKHLKAKAAAQNDPKNEVLREISKEKLQHFKRTEAEFKAHNLKHDKYVMRTNFAMEGGEDGLTCVNHISVFHEYQELLKTGKTKWVDLNNAKATKSEEGSASEGEKEAPEEEDEDEEEEEEEEP